MAKKAPQKKAASKPQPAKTFVDGSRGNVTEGPITVYTHDGPRIEAIRAMAEALVNLSEALRTGTQVHILDCTVNNGGIEIKEQK